MEPVPSGKVTFRAVRPHGGVYYVHCHLEILTMAGRSSGIFASGQDVTALERARQESRRLATRNAMLCSDVAAEDLLTRLHTRDYFTDEVDRGRRTADGALVVVATEPTTRLPVDLADEDRDRLAAAIGELLRAVSGAEVTCGLADPGLWGVLVTRLDERAEAPKFLAARLVDTLRRHLFSVHQETLA
ncbi:hypothetical protein [Actinoplanes sp. URMC 104]|uniref:hypothetical protein n=1 Tax=Actinoplanes sp. URMC 104 TaxID=3423409 RepID=UPI003F1D5300